MSMSPFFYIEIYNRKLGQWEKFDVYTRNEKDELAPVERPAWDRKVYREFKSHHLDHM